MKKYYGLLIAICVTAVFAICATLLISRERDSSTVFEGATMVMDNEFLPYCED